MSTSSETSRVSYAGNGSTTVFSFPYPFELEADLVVMEVDNTTRAETVKTISTHYTVSGEGEDAGGSVTMLVAPANGVTLVIYRDPAITQITNFVQNDPLPVEEIEKALDKQARISQRLDNLLSKSIRAAEGFTQTFDFKLPGDIDDYPDYAIAINSTGDGLALVDTSALTGAVTSLTGDVTGSGGGAVATTIANDAVTNAKMANMATQTIKGRTTAGTGDPEDLTATQATAILNDFVGDAGAGGTKGLVPAPASGDAAANKFLNADGTWKTSGGTITGGTNLGASGSSVFAQVNGANMEFRKLIAGSNITLTQNTNDITIDASPGGTGDVVGPASSVDNRVALFDGITGKLLKQSSLLISDLAPLASPALTGNPTAPTASAGDNDTSIATTAFVTTAIGEKRVVGTFTGTSVTPTTRAMYETFVYNGGSAQTFSTTGFGTISSLTNGYRAVIIGSDNTNTLTINDSDISDGRIMRGPIELGRGMVICFEYNSTIARMIEVYRSENNG